MLSENQLRVLTVRQPYAHLIMEGKQRFECRSFTTSYRGWLIIHAGKTLAHHGGIMKEAFNLAFGGLPCGVAVGLVYLSACNRLHWFGRHALCSFSAKHWVDNPYAWKFEDPVEFQTPVEWRGQLGITKPGPELVEAANAALSERRARYA